jgi:hypothetical protein
MGHATPWEAIVAQPHLVVLVILLLGLHRYITQNWAVPHVELHLYQYKFLTTLGGPTGASGGLQIILTRALAERQVREEIFGLVHCRHCGSVQPAEWIASAKGDKKRYSVDLPVSQQAFLKRPLICAYRLSSDRVPYGGLCAWLTRCVLLPGLPYRSSG